MRAVNVADLDFLACAWLRLPEFWREASQHVQPGHFDQLSEGNYLAIWRVASDLYSRYPTLDYESVMHACATLLATGGAMMQPQHADDLLDRGPNGLVTAAFATSPESLSIGYCRELLSIFLQERAVRWPLRQLAQQTGDDPGAQGNWSEQLAALAAADQRVRAATVLPVVSVPRLDEPTAPAHVYHPAGISWIDNMLGGHRLGDVNGFLALSGGGKSLFAGQLVAEAARESHRAAARGETPGLAVLCTYEESAAAFTHRVMSCAARIDRATTEAGDWSLFSSRPEKPYELAAGHRTGERERYAAAQEWVDQYARLIDMSGSPDHPGAGTGGVPEIAQLLARLRSNAGRPIRLVVIDWAEPLVDRHMAAHDIDSRERHRHLSALGNELRQQIAGPYDCTVWLTHQLRRDVPRAPNRPLCHTDAASTKAFAQAMSNCVVLSPADADTGVRMATVAKHRHIPDSQVRPVLLRPDDIIAEFTDVTSEYVRDDFGGGFNRRQRRAASVSSIAQTREYARHRTAIPTGRPGTGATPAAD